MISGKILRDAIISGANNINNQRSRVDELNVFPVPDGDTGTNMGMTIGAAVPELQALGDDCTVGEAAKTAASAMLRGARGNSGVITSLLFRGFSKALEGKKEAGAEDLVCALEKGVQAAYKAVMKPKEGTILTVAKGIAEKAEELAFETDDLSVIFPKILDHAQEVLDQTPEMLPVLKEAGVVDSGGQGLLEVLRGAYDAFLGKEIDYSSIEPSSAPSVSAARKAPMEEKDIKFGYCTEFIILTGREFTEQEEQEFKAYLESIGDSIVCVADDEVVKVHVHTNDPGLAIQKALTYGQLTRMKIDNMREEHHERVIQEAEKLAAQEKEKKQEAKERKKTGFIAVSIGEGMNEIFREIGVDYIIEGGQTMNPSTDDMLQAIEEVNADTIFILPNNKNIVLAANQARDLTKEKKIIVIPTKTVPQGITAVISFSPEEDDQANEQTMLEAIQTVKTGQVTYAVRDTRIGDKEIHEGDIMGIGDEGILSVGTSIAGTARELLDELVTEDSELISIYYGEDIPEEEADRFVSEVEEAYPDLDVDAHYGGQPIYYYVMSVE